MTKQKGNPVPHTPYTDISLRGVEPELRAREIATGVAPAVAWVDRYMPDCRDENGEPDPLVVSAAMMVHFSSQPLNPTNVRARHEAAWVATAVAA